MASNCTVSAERTRALHELPDLPDLLRAEPLGNSAPPRITELDAYDRLAPARGAKDDLATFYQIRAGRLAPEEGMLRIARSGGWPIRTKTGFLFARIAGDDRVCSLAGDHSDWKLQPMRKDGGVFWIHVATKNVDRYKLINAKGEFHADAFARRFGYDQYGEYSLARAAGAHLQRWPMMSDGVVLPRTVRVWVPKDPPTHHLYAHDGQNLFNPGGPHGGLRLNEVVGSSTLVIGIDNTRDRRADYTHCPDLRKGVWVGGKGDDYARFVEETLRPFIEAQYGEPRRVGLLGSSLGGVACCVQARKYRDAYDFVGSMSGTLGWGKLGADNPTMVDLFDGLRFDRTAFYLDSGGGPGKDNFDHAKLMAETLAKNGHELEKNLWYWHEPGAPHTERAWYERLHRPIRIFESL